jgi:hypothetical protein
MKITIEPNDIQDIQEILSDSGIIISDSLTEQLIKSDTYLLCDLMDGCTNFETVVSALVDFLDLKKDRLRLTWPCYGDSEQYSKEFYPTFVEAALEKGLAFQDDPHVWIAEHIEPPKRKKLYELGQDTEAEKAFLEQLAAKYKDKP